MFFKHLDYLSPSITFYHQGELSHSSIVSGIISVFSFLILLCFMVYYFLDFLQRNNPTSFYYSCFVDDADIFPFNASSFFHFISLITDENNLIDEGVNFKNFRIIGFDTYYQAYLYEKNLSKLDHWLYGYCNNESDTKGISNLIKYDFFEKSACIRKYFNSSEQKYYDTGDSKFKWPVIAHGTYHPENKLYSIIIERCHNDTVNLILGDNTYCNTVEQIEKSFGLKSAAHLYFIDHYVNVLNYKNPFVKYFYQIENVMKSENYPINHLNINPSLIKSHNGIIFDNIKKEISYSYDRHDMLSYINEDEEIKIYTGYYFWLKNSMNYYERSYKRIQDVISSIGGIFQFIKVVSFFINSLYNEYIVLIDTEELLFSSIYSEENNKKEVIKTENSKNKIKDLEKNNINNHLKKSSDRNIITNDNSGKKRDDKELSKSNVSIIEKYKDNFNDKAQNKSKLNKINNIDINKKKQNEEKENIKNEGNGKKNFWSFLLFKLSCEKKNTSFKIYKDFRVKIISENHLIRNHLNIYNLLKISEKKRNFRRNSYKLKDLINLI